MKNLNKYKITAIYILIIIIVIVVVDSGLTSPFRNWLKVAIPHFDKVGHFFAMGMLAFLLNNMFHKSNSPKLTLASLAGVIISLPIVTLEEYSQKYLAYRTFSYGDLAADYLGIVSFTIMFLFLIKRKYTSKTKLL